MRRLEKRKKIALIAHDNKKKDLIEWAVYNKAALDQQIGAMIATGDIDVIFFFFDPMEAQPHDSDVKALLRLAVAWNLPMACDRTTADFLMTSRFMQEVYEYKLPNYTHYLKRNI